MEFKDHLRFDELQQHELRSVGLSEEQVDLLEAVLPRIEMEIRKRPPRDDVRKSLSRLRSSLSQTSAAMTDFLHQSSDAADEARLRVRLVDLEAINWEPPIVDANENHPSTPNISAFDGEELLQQAQASLERARTVLDVAASMLPTVQRRRSEAKGFPVGLVDAALREGHRQHLTNEMSGTDVDYRFHVSRVGPFARIVAVCMEAVGMGQKDPDRAIRSFLKSNNG